MISMRENEKRHWLKSETYIRILPSGNSGGHQLFLGIGPLFGGQTHQIIQADMIIFRQLHSQLQRQGPFLAFVFGIQRLITHEIFSNFMLGQVLVLPQITDS